MPYMESFDEFCDRQNCKHVTLNRNSIRGDGFQVIFKNGARSDGRWVHSDPSADEYERLTVQKRYCEVRIARLSAQFYSDRQSIQQQLEWAKKYNGNVSFHVPGKAETQHLRTIRNRMRIQQRNLEQIQEQLCLTPKGKTDAEIRQIEEQEKANLQTRLHEISDELRHI